MRVLCKIKRGGKADVRRKKNKRTAVHMQHTWAVNAAEK